MDTWVTSTFLALVNIAVTVVGKKWGVRGWAQWNLGQRFKRAYITFPLCLCYLVWFSWDYLFLVKSLYGFNWTRKTGKSREDLEIWLELLEDFWIAERAMETLTFIGLQGWIQLCISHLPLSTLSHNLPLTSSTLNPQKALECPWSKHVLAHLSQCPAFTVLNDPGSFPGAWSA